MHSCHQISSYHLIYIGANPLINFQRKGPTMEDVQLYTTIIIVLGCIAAAMVKVGRAEKAQRSPPGPRGVPIVGHLHLIGPSPHKSLHELALIHGPILRLSLGSVPCVVVSSAEAAKEFLGTQETLFSNRPHLSVVNYLSYPSSDFTFAEHGPYWRLMKKLCMTRLLGSSTLDRLYPIRRAEIRKLLSSVILLRREGTREAIEVRRELTKLTSSVISRMIMSRGLAETDNEDEEIRTIVAESTEVLGEFNFSDYIWFCKGVDFQGLWKKSKRIHDRFDRLIERVIREREEDRKKKNGESGDEFSDLLDILLDVSEEEKEDRSSENIALTKEHIKAFVLDVLVAGTDTSSITIEWALAELINHPNTMQKAREELDSIVGQTRLVEESDIPNLPYIQAVVKETLRLHPPGPILLREAAGKSTVNVGGYEIAEKTRVLVNVWSIHRDPRHWENPLEFRPERFLDGRTVDVKGQSFDFLAFGSGRRGCPGTSLGLGIVQTALAALVQCFDWSVHGVLSMEEGRGFTLPMARPLVCSPTPRFSPIPL